jgi:hypothetical protein
VKYREGFIDTLHYIFKRPAVIQLHKGSRDECELWFPFHKKIVDYFEGGVTCLDRLKKFSEYVEAEIEDIAECKHCCKRAWAWANSVTNRVDSLPSFSTFL